MTDYHTRRLPDTSVILICFHTSQVLLAAISLKDMLVVGTSASADVVDVFAAMVNTVGIFPAGAVLKLDLA